MFNNKCVDNVTNKVYINPNFNRPTSSNHTSAPVMHVNPRFSHLLSNVQPNTYNKPRIYVNPNFMKTSVDDASAINTNSLQPTVVYNTNYFHPQEQPIKIKKKIEVPVPITKSRYCLVRQNTTKTSGSTVVEKTTKTYQVSKYKSIPLNDIKRNLDNAKNAISNQSIELVNTNVNNTILTTNKYVSTTMHNPNNNHFKLVNRIIAPVVRNDRIKTRSLLDTRKKIEIRLKRIKLKKNNIPCPSFRKFGKCLRKLRGNCEFLHDKKHVAICRKFLKGLCHDKECLFSHDLTAKKMPTCYFYLQGTCTKPDCPYLHVKLSEKVKICPDFLKGYCEKGSKCLQRHINTQSESKVKRSTVRISSINSKRKYNKIKQNNLNQDKSTQSNHNNDVIEKNENNSDGRYYQEHETTTSSTSESCEIIKPVRCKLGTLPSFIQL